ncbi:MAG: hypothetical protein JO181_09875 [Solirubrobacterales bacterium]|nr:hypothetical protein [Solirubrobacterales bacterium]
MSRVTPMQTGQVASIQAAGAARFRRRASQKITVPMTSRATATRNAPLARLNARSASGPSSRPRTRWTCRNTLLPMMSAGSARRPLSPETAAATTVSVRSPGVPRPIASPGRPRVSAKPAARRIRASVSPRRGPNRVMIR